MIKKTLTLFILLIGISANAWFPPPGVGTGRVWIARAETFDAWCPGTNYDYGATNAVITQKYGGDNKKAFECSWPITFFIYFTTFLSGVYTNSTLEYFEGNDSGASTNWTVIERITDFETVEGIEGAHFKLITWYPPKTNGIEYLIRVWAKVVDNNTIEWESGDKDETDINKDGNVTSWRPEAVLLIKTNPNRLP